ncbi:MAG: thioesterase family protein [Acidobacteriota bacterium]
MFRHTTTRRVEFADTDMAGIVHFARFFVFMEAAEHEALRSALGGDRQIHFEHEGFEIGWPRVRATCEYLSPARLGDVLTIDVGLVRRGQKSLTWSIAFRLDDRDVARGELVTICCRVGGPALESVPIPDFLAVRLDAAPAEPSGAPA